MAQTSTLPIPLGFQAPHFELPNVLSEITASYSDVGANQAHVDVFQKCSLNALKGRQATVVMFICNHCPFVKHILPGLVTLANDYLPKGVAFVAINANDVTQYPADSPAKMRKLGQQFSFPFPYLYDETQAVAKDYHAACTPDFSIFDGNLACVYRGQLDDSRPDNDIPVTGSNIRVALDALLAGRSVPTDQPPSIGCNIKWKQPTNQD